MAHHRDTNVPQKLNAEATIQFLQREDIIQINQRISALTKQIDGKPGEHMDLNLERSTLYNKKAKLLLKHTSDFIEKWWESSYSEHIAGNDFSELDSTPLYNIYKKYMPERARLTENLFKEASLDSPIGQQCLIDMVDLCKSTERVAYYPGMSPKEGSCPICARLMSR